MPWNFQHINFNTITLWDYKNPWFWWEKKINQKTAANLINRREHGNSLLKSFEINKKNWDSKITSLWLNEILDVNCIPLFLQIDSDEFKLESLKWFWIELISEEENGFIIWSMIDANSLEKKINAFLSDTWKYKNQAAKLWGIDGWENWRIEQILCPDLLNNWDKIDISNLYDIEVWIASKTLMMSEYPTRKKDESDNELKIRIDKWSQKNWELDKNNFKKRFDREKILNDFITKYNWEIKDCVELQDSFSCLIRISWQWLKDFAFTFPYVFEIRLPENIGIEDFFIESNINIDFNTDLFISPNENNPKVCIIDSWIQEEHIFLEKAINGSMSSCYLNWINDCWDYVKEAWHWTKVAGLVLFPNGIPKTWIYSYDCWLQNARILNSENRLDDCYMAPKIMETIIEKYKDTTKIFNLSINDVSPNNIIHMPLWASIIDDLSYKYDILFIISAWNISRDFIKDSINKWINYPVYLNNELSKISNPWHSLLSLTVGSICPNNYEDWIKKSISHINEVSSFSRVWPWIWNSIKPEVVEYWWENIININNPILLTTETETSIETVNSTRYWWNHISKDSIWTSFSAPKISNIIAKIQNYFPNNSTLFYRALLIQSSKWPINDNISKYNQYLSHYWYWLPKIEKAIQNDEYRITFYDESNISPRKANIYKVKVPEEIRRQWLNKKILIEVTLVYKAKPKRTRRKTKSYFSMTMSWENSKFDENEEAFKTRILSNFVNNEENLLDEDNTISEGNFKWHINNRDNWWLIKWTKRTNNTVQKDWAFVESYNLPEDFCVWVIWHKWWEKDLSLECPYSLIVSFEAINKDIEIYEQIREANISIEIESEIGS